MEGEGLDYPALRPGPGSLDDAAGGRPVFLFEYSGHSVWVNHAARQRLGIGAGTSGCRSGSSSGTRAASRPGC